MTAVFFTFLSLAMRVKLSSTIPADYNTAGGVPAVPPIGQIYIQVPVAQSNPQFVLCQ